MKKLIILLFLTSNSFWAVAQKPWRAVASNVDSSSELESTDSAEPILRRKVDLDWDPIQRAVSYSIQISHRGQTIFTSDFKDPSWSGELPPGKYQFRVRAADDRHAYGRWSALQDLLVPLEPVQVLQPQANTEIFTESESSEPVKFRWHKVRGAQVYKFHIQDSDNKDSQDLSTEQLELTLPSLSSPKNYDWAVRAIGPDQVESESVAVNEIYVRQKRIWDVHNWFATLTYSFVNSNYLGRSYDFAPTKLLNVSLNSPVGVNHIVQLGYFPSYKNWGFYTGGQVLTMTVNSVVNSYTSLDFGALYRQTWLEGKYQLHHKFGLDYKQIPYFTPTLLQTTNSSLAAVLGPEYGISGLYSFKHKWALESQIGLQANMASFSTPNGQSLSSTISYKFGFYLHYKAYSHWNLATGLSYNSDTVSFASLGTGTNTATLASQQINLLLEWLP